MAHTRNHIPSLRFDDRVRELERPKIGAFTSSRALTLQGSWASFNATLYAIGGFYKKEGGEVCICGTITGGSSGSVIATLPQGYRPFLRHVWPCMANGALAEVEVRPDGNIVHISGGTTKLSLDPVKFKAMQ